MNINTAFLIVSTALAGPGPAGGTLPGITDRQIAAVITAANTAEIKAGKYVDSRSQDGNVKEFAEQMIDEHKAASKSATDLTAKLDIKPEKNKLSQDVEKDAKKNLEVLEKLSGHQLDKTYVQQQATMHQAVLDMLDKVLVPNASNGELKALLEKTRATVEAHLEHARRLAETM